MHMLTIAFGGMGMAWKFGFKTVEAAEAAWAAATNATGHSAASTMPSFEIKDDFGQRGKFHPQSVTGVLLENLDEVKIIQIEHAIHNAKTQASIDNRIRSDPATAHLTNINGLRGPAMISPMSRM